MSYILKLYPEIVFYTSALIVIRFSPYGTYMRRPETEGQIHWINAKNTELVCLRLCM